jgi:hypothetical protein
MPSQREIVEQLFNDLHNLPVPICCPKCSGPIVLVHGLFTHQETGQTCDVHLALCAECDAKPVM